ncbi:MAG: hypothetical protein OIN66_09810 [Candidatus Methanoperedens sp.]|nr:hypothetical protein [Candidatus Methanoperedens sp.]
MHKKLKLALLVIIIAIVSIPVIIDSLSIGPKSEQIPMYALIFRGDTR